MTPHLNNKRKDADNFEKLVCKVFLHDLIIPKHKYIYDKMYFILPIQNISYSIIKQSNPKVQLKIKLHFPQTVEYTSSLFL